MIDLRQTQHQGLELRQTLSPQQILLSSLLQLPIIALEQKIKTEVELNPVLEIDDDVTEEPAEENSETEEALEGDVGEQELAADDEDGDLEAEEIDWDEILNDPDGFEPQYSQYSGRKDHPDIPNPQRLSLTDHLLEQVNLLQFDDLEREIAEQIIYNIDDVGYLSTDMEVIAANTSTTVDKVEEVLREVQHLEPVGIGSRNLRECLEIQLEDKLEETPDAEIAFDIVKNHFDDFANKRFSKIEQKTDYTKDDLVLAQNVIERLNPKPGEALLDPETNYIVPDLIVERIDDEFVISLNDGNIPKLQLSNYYLTLYQKGKKSGDKETKNFLKKKIDSARWFINSIHQRRTTMLRVMRAIVQRQYDFFDKGKEHLKPMILKDIAEDVDMDISTISRVTNGKYVQTDRGVYELKYFFTESIKTEDGEVSNRVIKDRIKDIVAEEDKQKPLSDSKIAKKLREDGYTIARRTVAKYREQQNIPVARLRREIDA
ncbi:MAG: RNA polymerase factor sigma-54 [Candidatus Marinimicrobia bacterium]|nr:RNA polymerase factor sigma-54 [Candidatus Neomarinimicrobiota bacterium]MCF7829506.1 RNA polymerase factor sigma-54 [Candidatus Neomarinimicrobiota bacterium]MCF7880096.1 RNA polymerase factor sigma-54 [Candidatus Neomarinimicrobiota bacterium]